MTVAPFRRALVSEAIPEGSAGLSCRACLGEGWVEREGGIDACPRCAREAEGDWRRVEHERSKAMWDEHTNRAGRGSDPSAVTLSASGGKVVLIVGRAVQEQLPWYRGGQPVALLLGKGANAGTMRVVRGDTHRLLAVVAGGRARLEKLPPVVLKVDAFAHMRPGAEHEAEAVAHRVAPGLLDITLPSWAAPQVPAVAPPTHFSQGHFLPHEDRDRRAAMQGGRR